MISISQLSRRTRYRAHLVESLRKFGLAEWFRRIFMTDLSLCPSPLLPLHIISIRVSPAMEFQGNTRSDCLLAGYGYLVMHDMLMNAKVIIIFSRCKTKMYGTLKKLFSFRISCYSNHSIYYLPENSICEFTLISIYLCLGLACPNGSRPSLFSFTLRAH